MNLTVSSYITSAGLQAVTSAGVYGPYFAVKYFLPIYDYRIDKTISREVSGSTSALSISALNLVSATSNTLFGEKIFANGNYTLDQVKYLYWKSSMGSLPDGINLNVQSPQSVTTDVNLESGKPISVVVSGSKFYTSASGVYNISGTHIVSGSELSTFNPLSAVAQPLSAFYRVTSYSPISNGLTSAAGEFKCRIPPSKGSFKFNGLALYSVKVDGNGFDDYGNGSSFAFNPTLFGVVLFDQAQYKQDTDGGINDFEISVDMGFDWNLASSGTTNYPVYLETNYWKKLPTASSTSAYGLNYDGDVVISSSAVAGSWTPRAKLTVTDNLQQQLRLANDNIRFTDFRTIRFPNNLIRPTPNASDRAVLSVDTSCPDDSLLQLGYKTSAVGIKSVAIGCYASATGYMNGSITDFSDGTPVNISDVKNTTGGYTLSIGVQTYSEGFGDVALGYSTSAIGYLNFAGGEYSRASYDPSDSNSLNPPLNGLNFAYGKYTSAISRSVAISNFDYREISQFDAEQESYGSNVSFGVRNISNGGLATTFGNSNSATGAGSFATGNRNLAAGHFSYVGGVSSYANSDVSFIHGFGVSANSPFGIGFGRNIWLGTTKNDSAFNVGIGENLSALGYHTIAIGRNAWADGINAIAIGQNACVGDFNSNVSMDELTIAWGINSIAIGKNTSAYSNESIAIGPGNVAGDAFLSQFGSMVFGNNCVSLGDFSLATGYKTSAIGPYSFTSNYATSASGAYSVALGLATKSAGSGSLAIGYMTSAMGSNSFAGTSFTSASGENSFAVGSYAVANQNDAIAIGYMAKSNHSKSVAIGYNAQTTQDNQVVIGSCDGVVNIKGSVINFGSDCNSVINLPSAKQLNNSIRFGVEINQDAGISLSSPRRISLELVKNGITTRVDLVEQGPVGTDIFTVTKCTGGPFYAYSHNDNPKATKLQVGMILPLFLTPFKYLENSLHTFTVLYDTILDAPIIELGNLNLNGITPEIIVDFIRGNSTLLSEMIFVAQTQGIGTQPNNHTFVWQNNVNMFTSYIHYIAQNGKANATGLDTNARNGNAGICAYDLKAYDFYGGGRVEVVNSINQTPSMSAHVNGFGNVNAPGMHLAGMFINSGNVSVVTTSTAEYI